jgi:hypothetical protein
MKNIYISDLQWTYNDQFKKLPLNPYEIEIKKLQDNMKQMKAQQIIEKRKKEDLETEVSLLWDENDYSVLPYKLPPPFNFTSFPREVNSVSSTSTALAITFCGSNLLSS